MGLWLRSEWSLSYLVGWLFKFMYIGVINIFGIMKDEDEACSLVILYYGTDGLNGHLT